MSSMESLAQLELLCEKLYNSRDSAERAHAESILKCFSENSDYISQCQYILDNASTPYALMLASSSLLNQVNDRSLSLQLRLDIRNYVINYLATRGPKLQTFVIKSLIQLVCRITKFGWFDDDKFRDIVKEAADFLSLASQDHYFIGLKILYHLVGEMNQANAMPLTLHRKIACSFKDQFLLQIFQISLTSLHQLKSEVPDDFRRDPLSLALRCLSYDFVGCPVDESSEEFGTVQLPASWRPLLQDPSTVQIFFDYYKVNDTCVSKEALECLVRLASVRRSIFVEDPSRTQFLSHLMSGTKEILQTGQGLADHGNYHEFCRLLGRFKVNFQYQNSSIYIINIMEPLLQAYMERSRLPAPGDANELSVIEGQLTWLVHIIAAILKIRQTIGCSQESQELIDAELAARVLQLINVTDTGVHAQQLYARLSELLGLNDHLVLLNVIVGKIATNLKCYAECEDVIDHTLSLFLELASGYMTGKLLLKLESTKFIIANHSRETFPFLEEYRCARSRTTFYYILGCLVFMEDTPVKFRSFMEPLLQVAVNLEATADAAFRTDVVKYAFIGLMRDLRGIAMATNSRRTYGLLFDWLYPSRMPLLLKAISLYADEPVVTTPLLKFMCEFVLNKAQRLTFDSSSPNGILLFREVSKLIVAYGSRILLLPNGTDIYGSKYKGIWISLAVLSRALCGNYVNFGVFELYGDRALADALDISLKMSLSVPLSDILAFKKLSKAFYGYIEVLFSNHITFVLNLDTNTFVHIVSTLESGLKGLDTGISTQCASAIDSLAAFYFNNITAADGPPSPAALNLARHIGEFPTLFPQILKTLFEIIIFEDAGNQWSLSRPILSLIMISEQPVDQQQRLSQCFDKLMTDVATNLEPKNRDKFTQNLTTFRHDFRTFGARLRLLPMDPWKVVLQSCPRYLLVNLVLQFS
uniref:Importin N-terminal domain-containing protein n=1 Tax=Oryza meridionalis TaxID=40149 RepID=A0A0E0D3P9_9ORYZ